MADFSRIQDVNVLQTVNELLLKENERLRNENAALLKKMEEVAKESNSAVLQQELEYQKDLLARREKELFSPSTERRPTGKKLPEGDTPRRGHGPTPQPNLKLVEVMYELPTKNRDCPACGGMLVEMGDQTEDAEEISVLAKEFIRILHRRKKYRCACNGHVETAPGPEKLVAGGRYSLEFAVDVAVAKYCDHMPLERQVKVHDRLGLTTTSQALYDQVERLAVLLQPTYEAILAEVLKAPLIHADETYWQVMSNGKATESKKWWSWCIASQTLVGYRILPGRSTQAARDVLGAYAGIVMADGYGVYSALSREGKQPMLSGNGPKGFRLVNCWAHVRRKFVEAEPNFPEAAEVLDLIGQLYDMERLAKEGPPEELLERRQRLRMERSRELVEQIFDWAKNARVLPRSALGQAIAYMQDLKPGLVAFLEDPLVPLDNNHGERALRGMVIGRKNHYGSRSQRGTEVAALFYTLFESAKLSGVEPMAYVSAAARQALRDPAAVLLPSDFRAHREMGAV